MSKKDVLTLDGVHCYLEADGTAYLKLEDVARGLGFTTVATSGNKVIRWSRVRKYLEEFGFSQEVGKDDYIPEQIFYKLAMKASNEVATTFQDKIAYEIIPTIRKTGSYTLPEVDVTHDIPDTPIGDVATWGRLIRSSMKDMGKSPKKIAEAIKLLADQWGIAIPDDFCEVENEQYRLF